MNFFRLLPNEVIEIIFSYLSVSQLGICCCVCRFWNHVANSNSLWIRHLKIAGCEDELVFLQEVGNELVVKKCLERRLKALHNWKLRKSRKLVKGRVSEVVSLGNGSLLAVSFLDGSLKLFDVEGREGPVRILEPSARIISRQALENWSSSKIGENSISLKAAKSMLAVNFEESFIFVYRLRGRSLVHHLTFTRSPSSEGIHVSTTLPPDPEPFPDRFALTTVNISETTIVVRAQYAERVRIVNFLLETGNKIGPERSSDENAFRLIDFYHEDSLIKVYETRLTCEKLNGEIEFVTQFESSPFKDRLLQRFVCRIEANSSVIIVDIHNELLGAWERRRGKCLLPSGLPYDESDKKWTLHPSEALLLLTRNPVINYDNQITLFCLRTQTTLWEVPLTDSFSKLIFPLSPTVSCISLDESFALLDLSTGAIHKYTSNGTLLLANPYVSVVLSDNSKAHFFIFA